MNKKGFTLIELIVVIAIMGVILILALPQISSIQRANRDRKYEAYKESLVSASKLYVYNHARDMFGYNDSGCAIIKYSDLKGSDLIKDFASIDVTCSRDTDTFVEVRKVGNNYKYAGSLVCRSKDGQIVKSIKDDLEGSSCINEPDENGPIMLPYINDLKNEDLQKLATIMWNDLETFVFYNYPTFDRIRKAAYQDKSRCLYTDTDSVFISLDHLVDYCKYDVYGGKCEQDEDTLASSAANFMMIFLNLVVDKVLKTLCYTCNVTPELAKRLGMKNEFFFKKIIFTEKKKRYISLALIQEGQVLNNGKGMSEIKGFDFIKSTTKDFLRDFYTNICLDDILYPPNIRPSDIFHKMIKLKNSIEAGVRGGDMKYFKQSAVKSPDLYKNPFQTQGVTSILLWNALCPNYAMEFPADVNIVPIIDLRWEYSAKRTHPLDVPNIKWFAERYPEDYNRLHREIYSSSNQDLRHMGMKYIATPKNPNIPVPQVIYDIIDYKKIVDDAIGLFLPVMNSIGIKSLDVSSTETNMSNMVEL